VYADVQATQDTVVKTIHISDDETVEKLKRHCCAAAELDPDSCELWDYYRNNPYGIIESSVRDGSTIEDAKLVDGNPILLVECVSDGVFPDPKQQTWYNSYNVISHGHDVREDTIGNRGRPVQRGIVGLSNLGNTCFMNSSLQCLIGIPPIANYILSEKYMTDLNRDNPLGMQGKVAEAFATLVKLVWGNTAKSVEPRGFKQTIGQFAPQFSGYQQHDSQELLNFLLDGLHEDLNRICVKPSTEDVEAKGRPDAEVAAEAWQRDLSRNASLVWDWMAGQYKSTVKCHVCSTESITFDPYTALSLPLQVGPQVMNINVIFVSNQSSIVDGARRFTISIIGTAKVKDLLVKIAEVVEMDLRHIVLSEIDDGSISTWYDGTEDVDTISESSELYAYEVDNASLFQPIRSNRGRANEMLGVVLIHSTCLATARWPKKIGTPLLIQVEAEKGVNDLWHIAECKLRECLRGSSLDYTTKKTPPVKTYYAMRSKEDMMKGEVMYGYDRTVSHLAKTDMDGRKLLYVRLEWAKDPQENALTLQAPLIPNASLRETPKQLSLQDCLDNFQRPEHLGDQDMVYCRTCKEHVEATKTLQVWSLPRVLVIQLKRFKYTTYSRSKIECEVNFPLDGLDLSDYVTGAMPTGVHPLYTCVAVSNHMGGMGGGHYTAYVRSVVDHEWYSCDDSFTSKVHENEVVSPNAYVLFYIRQDVLQNENWADKLGEFGAGKDEVNGNDDVMTISGPCNLID